MINPTPQRRSWARLASLSTALTIGLCGCPRSFNATASPPIVSGDSQAQAAFEQAKALFVAGSLERADAEFRAFNTRYPKDVLAPLAQLFMGRIALKRGRLKEAKALLEPLVTNADAALAQLARYHLGISHARSGAWAASKRLLEPLLLTADASTSPAILVALARSARGLKAPMAAATYLARLHSSTTRPAEKLYARRELSGLFASALRKERDVRALYASAVGQSTSLLLALAAQRLIALELARGDIAAADKVRQVSAAARQAHNVLDANDVINASASGPVGLLLPFSGRFAAIGRIGLRGASSASGAFEKGAALQLLVRDSSQDAAASARELIEKQHVVALIGTFAGKNARAVQAVARRFRVPFLSLSGATKGSGGPTLRLLPDNAARAEALAAAAIRAHSRAKVAILRPENRFGKAMARAFSAALKKRGGATVLTRAYETKTTSFTDHAKALAKKPFDMLFVPDTARRLSLIAPALAASGLWPTKKGGKASKGRAIGLLATADGLTSRSLTGRRYVQGAILAPGFFADETAGQSGALVRLYRQIHGRPPGLIEAFAHDGVRAIRHHLARGVRNRSTLLSALQRDDAQGMTGSLRFSTTGLRAAAPLLYRVSGGEIKLLP